MVKAASIIENVIVKKRKKNISRNKKKSWRKNTDIADVESHLEQLQDDERTKG